MNRTTPYLTDPESASPEELETGIENTRHRMDETLEKISDKLDPRPYVDEAVDWVRRTGDSIDTESIKESISEAGRKTGEFARENPLPLIFGGLAIASAFLPAHLFQRGRKQEDATEDRAAAFSDREDDTSGHPYRYQPHPLATPTARQLPGGKVMAQRHHDRPGPTQQRNGNGKENGTSLKESTRAFSKSAAEKWNDASDSVASGTRKARETIEGATEQAQEKLHEASHRAARSLRQAARSTGETAGEISRKTRDRLEKGRQDHPLALGAGALAAGLVAALLVPRTRQEDRMCGEEATQFRKELRTKGETMLDDSKQALADNDLDPQGLRERAENAIESAGEKARKKIDDSVEPG